jgi:hypothetical protein
MAVSSAASTHLICLLKKGIPKEVIRVSDIFGRCLNGLERVITQA